VESMSVVASLDAAASPRTTPEGWLLDADGRGNAFTTLDRRRGDGRAYTAGNDVRPLVHGSVYFAELLETVQATVAGDLVMFTDWRGDPTERLDGYGTEVSRVLCAAASRGVIVKGLVWRSHWDKFAFSSQENDHLGDEIEAAGGECLRDMRVRTGGSHHQKIVVVRHPGRPERDVAYVGGIDLCHSRADDVRHHGDDQPLRISDRYGNRPPWHDVQLAIRGPAVGDVEASFRERWTDPSPLTRNPLRRLRDLVAREDTKADPMPAQTPDPGQTGGRVVQVLRTYPYRRMGYPFAPDGERSIARAYLRALERVESLIYLEDQYLWSVEIATRFADVLARRPKLHMIGVVPMHPDQNGLSGAAQDIGRAKALRILHRAAPERIAVYGIENALGTPIYVHAKACVMDDVWTCVGSDNVNLRSWTHDSELSCAVMDEDGGTDFGRALRLQLHREHLERGADDDADMRSAAGAFTAYAQAAARLDAWYAGGRRGPRPPGRLRRYSVPHIGAATAAVAAPIYHLIADPDGRPRRLRRARQF
jgi:phosphatidylserine/phosphatidylglycerophosphate/cardiolipin synthase-like enzyme